MWINSCKIFLPIYKFFFVKLKFYEVILYFLNSNQLLVFCFEENVAKDRQPVAICGFDPCEKYHSIQLKTKHKNYLKRISCWMEMRLILILIPLGGTSYKIWRGILFKFTASASWSMLLKQIRFFLTLLLDLLVEKLTMFQNTLHICLV